MHTHNGIFWKSGILDSGFLRTYLIHAIDNNIIEKLRYKMHKPNKMVHLGLWAQRFTKVLRENLELHQISRLLGMSIIWDNKQEGINRRSEIKRQEAKLWFLKIPKISTMRDLFFFIYTTRRQSTRTNMVEHQVLNPFDDKIDLSTSKGCKIFKEGIKLLNEKFNRTPKKATFFQTKVIDASKTHC